MALTSVLENRDASEFDSIRILNPEAHDLYDLSQLLEDEEYLERAGTDDSYLETITTREVVVEAVIGDLTFELRNKFNEDKREFDNEIDDFLLSLYSEEKLAQYRKN